VEPTNGIEPLNLFLTKEALYRLSYVGDLFAVPFFSCFLPGSGKNPNLTVGAGDETRTRDIQLGRLKLYQLSYSRSYDYRRYLRRRNISQDNKKVPLIVQNTPAGSHVVINDPDIVPKSPTYALSSGWWWGEDSNLRRLRRQIYSLFPLAAREPHLLVIDKFGREPANQAIIFPRRPPDLARAL
jgi:hypothetical protein